MEAAQAARRAGARPQEVTFLINAVEFAIQAGEWDRARGTLDDLLARQLTPNLLDSVLLDGALLATRRGDLATARDHLDRVSTASRTDVALGHACWYRWVLASLLLAQGDPHSAYEEAMQGVTSASRGSLNRLNAATAATRAALRLRDAGAARRALDARPEFPNRMLSAEREGLDAAVGCLEGRPDAPGRLRAVLAERRAAGDRLGHAELTVDALEVAPDVVPAGSVSASETFLRALGAAPLLDRLEHLRTGVAPLA
jgi:ATP/maltotriose-dependent transcriptional regulator MalT